MVVRPVRFGGVMGGLFLLMDAIVFAIIASRGQIHGPGDAILAVVVFGCFAMYGLNGVFVAVLARIVVDDHAVEVRNGFGVSRRYPRELVRSAARRSIFAPAQAGIYRDELLLIGENGLCLARVWVSDYDIDQLKALVESLDLKWPSVRRASIRRVRQEFPGAHAINYQLVTVGILAVVAVFLALITLTIMTH
jgi:hypothetical protein